MNRKTLNFIVGGLLVLVFALWLFVFKVRQSEIALVTTFGKPTGEPITNAAAYLKWPWPIQKVLIFDKRVQNLQDKLDESGTADGKILLCQIYLGWQIQDPAAFYSKFAGTSITDPEGASIAQAESKLQDIARSAKRARIGKHAFSDLISTDASQFKFDQIEHEMLDEIQANVKSNNYGLEVKYLGIRKLELPSSTTEAVFAAMKSSRQVLVAEIEARGAREEAQIRQQANSDSQRKINEAQAQAKEIQGEGQAQATAYLSVFEQDPTLANFLLQENALQSALGKNSVLILDGDTVPFNLFKNQIK